MARTWGDRLTSGFLAVVTVAGLGCGGFYLYMDRLDREDQVKIVYDVRAAVAEPPAQDPWNVGMDQNLLRRIDFADLTSRNPDATRWMYVPGTTLDDPVMQERTVGRYFYDQRGFDKRWNVAGSFLVPAEPIDPSTNQPAEDARTIILGHRMNSYNGEWQFSNLPIRWGTAQGAAENPYVYIYYPDHAERWRVWAGLDAHGDDMLYEMPYERGSDDYRQLLDHMKNDLARYTVGDGPTKDDPLLVMSTCNHLTRHDLGRFALVSVLDATYEYDSARYVSYSEDKQAHQWWMQRDQARKSVAVPREDIAQSDEGAQSGESVEQRKENDHVES